MNSLIHVNMRKSPSNREIAATAVLMTVVAVLVFGRRSDGEAVNASPTQVTQRATPTPVVSVSPGYGSADTDMDTGIDLLESEDEGKLQELYMGNEVQCVIDKYRGSGRLECEAVKTPNGDGQASLGRCSIFDSDDEVPYRSLFFFTGDICVDADFRRLSDDDVCGEEAYVSFLTTTAFSDYYNLGQLENSRQVEFLDFEGNDSVHFVDGGYSDLTEHYADVTEPYLCNAVVGALEEEPDDFELKTVNFFEAVQDLEVVLYSSDLDYDEEAFGEFYASDGDDSLYFRIYAEEGYDINCSMSLYRDDYYESISCDVFSGIDVSKGEEGSFSADIPGCEQFSDFSLSEVEEDPSLLDELSLCPKPEWL